MGSKSTDEESDFCSGGGKRMRSYVKYARLGEGEERMRNGEKKGGNSTAGHPVVLSFLACWSYYRGEVGY